MTGERVLNESRSSSRSSGQNWHAPSPSQYGTPGFRVERIRPGYLDLAVPDVRQNDLKANQAESESHSSPLVFQTLHSETLRVAAVTSRLEWPDVRMINKTY